MRDFLLRRVIRFDWWRIARTQQFSDLIQTMTSRDCFDQRGWSLRACAIASIFNAELVALEPLSVLGMLSVLCQLAGAASIWHASATFIKADGFRRRHPDFLNPEVVNLNTLLLRTVLTGMLLEMIPIAILTPAPTQLVSLVQITLGALAMHLDACQPRPPAPILQPAFDSM